MGRRWLIDPLRAWVYVLKEVIRTKFRPESDRSLSVRLLISPTATVPSPIKITWLMYISPHIYYLGLKKKLFVSCNPTLTSFYQKNPYPKFFSALPTQNQCKTCIKHTFLTKKIMQKFFFLPTYLPYFFSDRYTNTGNNIFFLALIYQ